MNSETKTCQNCKQSFKIEADDFNFYEKINVPPPTWCPNCRAQRRLIFRNERTLYRRKCDLCGKDIISIFHKDSPQTVYCQPCWWSDKWDPTSYSRDYDFSRPFFEQFLELYRKVPLPALSTFYTTLVNSEYVNQAGYMKNCYLLFDSDYDENCAYGTEVEHSHDCFDCLMINGCSLAYECVNCQKCYEIFYSMDCDNSHHVWFSRDLIGCSYCFGCTNLRNKQYHIFNKPYSKEEYEREIKRLSPNSKEKVLEMKEKVEEFFLTFPRKYIRGRQNTNVSGDYIHHSKEVFNSYIVTEAQNCKYCMWLIVKPIKDCWDYAGFGNNAQNMYENMNCGQDVSDISFSSFVFISSSRIKYSIFCYSSQDLFGCVGLRRKSYYIFNKEYSKEDYEKLVPQIIEHMNKMPYTDGKGRVYKYGEFFPPDLSPFAYNETTAIEYFPLTETEVLENGYSWKETEKRDYKVTTVGPELEWVIGCEHGGKCNHNCTTAFKLIPQELQFYKRMNIPLPQLCHNCRHHERLGQRNIFKLSHRRCQCAGASSENKVYQNNHSHFHGAEHCPNEFETSYSPDRKEIVYCEQCYNTEVA
ncbi:MAG TPA: hypothetical protein VNK70_02350 [Candidatus Paceibacterota bacterium]|nr:hypothetical protein [Candidatus Paceibacterota bacterium]